MSRILANIILILIIAFTVSAVPINTEILNLNISFPDVNTPEQTQVVEEPVTENTLTYTYQDKSFDYLYNPQTLDMKFIADASISPEQAQAFVSDLKLEVYQGKTDGQEAIVKRLAGNDLSEVLSSSTNGDVLTVSVDVSSKGLHLANGHYTTKISSTSQSLNKPFEENLHMTYFNQVTYKGPQAKASRGNRLITLYFTDPGKNYLVPVSREIKDNGRLIRTTLNALRDGPAQDSGLNPTSPAPYVPAARFSTITEMVSLETNSYENANFTQTDEDTYLMIHSLVNTMTHIENVTSVKFSVDKKDSQPLNGIDISKAYPRPEGAQAHLALQLENNRLYLIPQDSDAKTASEMLTTLKYGLENSEKLFNPVLPQVNIIEESLQDNVLKLTLSKSIHDAYAGNDTYAQTMMDSIVQSLATLPGVDELEIQTEIQTDGSLYGYTLGEAFTPARFLNVE